METKTIFEKSQLGQKAWSLPKSDPAFDQFIPNNIRHDSLYLPEVSEIDLTRHFNFLARRNMGIDTHFYPLGSCTMKLNPRVNEWAAGLPGFTKTHPLAPDETVQGNIKIMTELLKDLCRISGMVDGTLLPNAGAQGEFTGIKMIAEYHRHRGDHERNEMLIPDNAHGTNPATAAMVGYKIITIKSNPKGDLDLDDLKKHLSPRTAGLMITNPNTLGLFSAFITTITQLVHDVGGLLYYDGANLNAILNVARPGDMGFDVMHINLHKTFSTPHGGGGPGSGPVLCNERLKPFLPLPRVIEKNTVWKDGETIGHMATFHGNFGIYLRAYLYIKLHGDYGLRKIAEFAVVNANYLKAKISQLLKVPYPQFCMHEFVVQADSFLDEGIRAVDIAKRLLDYDMYAPTVYFPLIVKECMLIEPTESESKDTLDKFVNALAQIITEVQTNPELVKTAPHTQPVSRLDDVQAAKRPILKESNRLRR